MTPEELIAKAIEHAKRSGVPDHLLTKPRFEDAAVVFFEREGSDSKLEFYLDRVDGRCLTAIATDEDFFKWHTLSNSQNGCSVTPCDITGTQEKPPSAI